MVLPAINTSDKTVIVRLLPVILNGRAFGNAEVVEILRNWICSGRWILGYLTRPQAYILAKI